MEQYNFSNKEEYELIAQGEYEVTLEKAELKTTKDGSKDFINCKFKIRSDIEQPGKNKVVFDKIWRDKANPSQFDHRKLQKLLLVQGPSGVYNFSDDEHLIQFINGLNMRITVLVKDADDYNEDNYNEVKYLSYKPSNQKPQTIPTVTRWTFS